MNKSKSLLAKKIIKSCYNFVDETAEALNDFVEDEIFNIIESGISERKEDSEATIANRLREKYRKKKRKPKCDDDYYEV